MTTWAPLLFLEAALKNAENRLASDPGNIELRFERAIILNELGRSENAKTAYIEILRQDPTHFGALNNFGALLTSLGMPTAAIIAYKEAVQQHPTNPKGYANLADTLFKQGDSQAAFEHFKKALELDPDYQAAHQGLAYIYSEMRDDENARIHRQKGYNNNYSITVPYRGQGTPLVMLMLASSVGGMIPIRHHLDDQTFYTTVIFVEFYDINTPLPPHQIVFNIIGDADLCKTDLDAASALLTKVNAPIINHPDKVKITGRADNAAKLADIPGLITPKIVSLTRDALSQSDAASLLSKHGFRWPLLLRSPGYHTGRNFILVKDVEALQAALPELPGKEVLIIEYLDARNKDGKIRKYRVMMIDGKLLPLHVAISSDWKVHYFTADMADNVEHRAEDKRFLENMPEVLGNRAMNALKILQKTLQLDYAGADFSLDDEGNVLLFEANATMVVNAPNPDERWTYRRAPTQRIAESIREMMKKRIGPVKQNPLLDFPSTVQLLTMGGDNRIVSDPVRGVNKYGCPSIPEPKLLSFGSATASTISGNGYVAAEKLNNDLQQALLKEQPHEIYAQHLNRIRAKLTQLLGLSKTDIIFSPSGTDLHMLAAQLVKHDGKLQVVLIEAEETGSGVPEALMGINLKDTHSNITITTVKRREKDGTVRPLHVVDSEVSAMIEPLAKSGEAVLLVLTDMSKTGLISPSPSLALSLLKNYPEQVTVLVDACQFRLSPATVQSYLEHNAMLAITGSKFATGPAFSGALLVPEALSKKLRKRRLPDQINAYSMRADWPEGWAAQRVLGNQVNFGLLLRWEAALTEMQAFYALPEGAITSYLESFASAINLHIAQNPIFVPLPVDGLGRKLTHLKTWDSIQTIFLFMLRHPASGIISHSDINLIYQKLRMQDCQLGQSVLCGTHEGVIAGALRLCNSMRLTVEALSPNGRGVEAVIKDAIFVLNKIAELVKAS